MLEHQNIPALAISAALTLILVTLASVDAASNEGVEFWAIDLDNLGGGGSFGIVVANTGTSDATVTVSNTGGTLQSQTVPSGGLHTFSLPRAMVQGTGVSSASTYLVQSDGPIVAYQFNPLQNVYTNDASLLLPKQTLGTDYFVMSYEQAYASVLRGFVTVVATEDDTEVAVTVTANTAAGGAIPALAAGDTVTYTLNAFEALTIESLGVGDDMTGTHVASAKKVAVFGGSECSFVPTNQYACDHLEEQMFPTSTLGSGFDFCRSKPRGTEPDLVRIVASSDETTISTSPALPGTPVTLNAGEWVELTAYDNVEIDADGAVLVAQYLVGQSYGANTGDPAMILVAPSEQYRSEYMFLTPSTFAFDYVTVTAPDGATVTLDGTDIPASDFVSIGSSGMSCATVAVADGTHEISSAASSFGIAVYGYDQYASYGYPGGLELAEINCNEEGFAALRDATGGAASGTVHQVGEPIADELLGIGTDVHIINCGQVVPLEHAVEETLGI